MSIPRRISSRGSTSRRLKTSRLCDRVRTGARECAMLRWGLIPSWAKDEKIGARMINARSETAAEKPSFRSAVKSRRCLVPASGFYEWVKGPDGKQPHFIHFADARTFAFAGLWERWSKGENGPLETFTILTTTPNDLISDLHDRMPVILPPETYVDWLEPGALASRKPATTDGAPPRRRHGSLPGHHPR